MVRVTAVALAWALLLADGASAGVIRGVVHVSSAGGPSRPALNAYPGRADAMPGMTEHPRGAVTDAIVYVERIPPGVDSTLPRPSTPPRLAQKDQCFLPRVLPVAVGTAVDFPNLDPIYHNVFSLSPIKRFDLGKYPRGHSKRLVFDRVGLVNVYCDIHSSMAAFVLVLPHHAFTQPNAAGEFRMPALPAGHYVLHVWHPDFSEARREIDLPAGGDVTVEVPL